MTIYAFSEPFFVRLSFYEIEIPNKTFEPFIAVQLSDIHMQWPYPQMNENKLKEIVSNVNQINPDFVFLTGDYISRFYSDSITKFNIQSLVNGLKGIQAKKGVFAILGNNDFRALNYVINMFESLNIQLLRNESVKIGDILITGVDPSKNMLIAKNALEIVTKTDPIPCKYASNTSNNSDINLKIILSHEPDSAKVTSDYDYDLQLSGHTHGGQCVAPFGLGPIILPTMGWRFPLGLYKIQNLLLFVSTGIGISPPPKPPVRFNNRPEISVLKIVPK